MKIIEKTLDQAVVTAIERVGYELEARKSVVAEMLAQNMDTSTEAFARYQKELVSFTVQYETAKKALQKEYVDPIPGAVRWSLDYETCVLSITVDGDPR